MMGSSEKQQKPAMVLADVEATEDLQSSESLSLTERSINEMAVEDERLVTELLRCAEIISGGDIAKAYELLTANDRGGRISQQLTATERMVACFAEALLIRLGEEMRCTIDQRPDMDKNISRKLAMEESYRLFYSHCPYLIVSHFAVNQAFIEAFQYEKKLHILDLDICIGLQWPSLIQALSSRETGPPAYLKITMVGTKTDVQTMHSTKAKLLEFSDLLHLHLQVYIVTQELQDLQPWMLSIKKDEALAVNCVSSLNRLLARGSKQLTNFLRMIHTLQPTIVSVVEPDHACHCHPSSFLPGFIEALHFYTSIFHSLEVSFPSSSGMERAMVEKLVIRDEIVDIVAKEGRKHQQFEEWIRCMEASGFSMYHLSNQSVMQVKCVIRMQESRGYQICEDPRGFLSVGWQHNSSMYCISCWTAPSMRNNRPSY